MEKRAVLKKALSELYKYRSGNPGSRLFKRNLEVSVYNLGYQEAVMVIERMLKENSE